MRGAIVLHLFPLWTKLYNITNMLIYGLGV